MRAIASWALFPLVFVGSIGGATWAVERGVGPDPIILAAFVISVAVIALFERVLPYRREWNRSQGDLAADSAYLPLYFVVGGLVSTAAVAFGVLVGSWLSRTLDVGLWPQAWPLLSQFALACVVAEFFDYWAHRIMHENAWLWRFHATHHSAPRVYWLNGLRMHPFEAVFRGMIGLVPLGVVGASEPLLALVGVTSIVISLFQHANFDFRLGPLSWIFSVGELHYWHHSRKLEEANSNYGNNFIFWDAVFGTRYLPRDRKPPTEVGVENLGAFPRTFGAQLISPWRWSAIVADSTRSQGS